MDVVDNVCHRGGRRAILFIKVLVSMMSIWEEVSAQVQIAASLWAWYFVVSNIDSVPKSEVALRAKAGFIFARTGMTWVSSLRAIGDGFFCEVRLHLFGLNVGSVPGSGLGTKGA